MADWQLIEEGLKRGYSLDEVTDIIAKEEGVDPSYARERGFDSPAILRRLGYVKPEEVKPEKGFIGNVLDQAAHGVKTAYQGLLSAPGIYAGNPDAERIAGTIQAEQSHEKPKEMREAEAAFADVSKRQSDFESVYGKDSGYMDSIGKIMDMLVTTGKEIVTNPKGMAYEMASQSGNMVAPMVGAYAGGKTGAVTGALLGPKGAVAGGVVGAGAGGFAGSHVMEQSGEFRGKVAERLSELGLEPTAENVSAIFQDKAWLDKTLEETRDKATGTAVTDGVLAAIGGLAVNAPIRAAQKTARAQLGATATAKQVSDAAADILASQPKWQKVAPHLKAGAIGWGGEPISEATGQQYGYGHVDYGDVGMEAFAAAGEGIGSVYAAAKGMRTKPTLPANVTPPPSITSASSTDDAIKAFKDEVETVSPAPRGSFSGMDDLAGLIESERSDLGKRRGLLAQQQQEARDMEAEFSGLVKDEQIDQSYRLNDAQKQRDAERAREGGYDLALQQREEQQGRTVEQLAAASEAQGFGAEEPTAMQLAMQRAQQKALDNEFSGLLKQERANLNEMRANVKRVAGVPVEQISTPQLEEIAQSEAHPNTKMAAVAALNDRHDAIQQERERLMQLRETRLEKQSNQPEQGAQHGAESHGTDGQVATPSVAGGGANVSGGGFDAAMVAADRGMRETVGAGAAVSSGGQVGAVPVAEQSANVRALTENAAKRQATQLTNQGYPTVAYPHPTQAGMWAIGSQDEAKAATVPATSATQNDAPPRQSASWVIRNKETGEVVMETFDRKKVDALNTAKYEAVPIREYLEGLNNRNESTAAEPPAVEVRAPVQRKRPASNNIAQAIINLGGISTSLKQDITGDASVRSRPGLFTKNGTADLSELAARLSSEFGFYQIDLNDPTDNSGAKQLADLIASSVNGETILNEEAMIRAQQDEEFEQAKAEVNLQAQEIGIKPIRGKRTIDIVQSEINAILAEREEMSRQKKKAQLLLDEVAEQELIEAFDLAMQEYHDETAISRDESRVESARLSAEESAQGDGDSVDQASPVAGRASPTEGGRGEAEVTPEFGLVGQTEEEAIAEEQARRDVGHHNLHSIHAVLLRAVESIIPDMQRFERVFGKSQWAGYAKKLINNNDVLKGFLSQTVVGDEAKFKIALAKAADSKALESIADRLRRAMPQPEAKEIGDFGEKIGAAREGQGAEVAPEFGLVGQTEAEARAEQGRLNQPEGLTKEQIDREATAPFSLHSDVMPPAEGPTGRTESMFTPDGRATKAAGDKPAEAVERPAREFIGTGDKLYSESGRALSPAPKIETGSARKTNASIKRMNAWLLDEARKEAEANGNDWQQTLLRGIDANKMQQPDLDTVNDILFGDPDGPQAKHRAPHDGSVETPKAAQSILKPLSEPTPLHPDRTSTIAAVRRGDLTPEDVAEAHPVEQENGKDSFTLERLNRDDNTLEPVMFARGEYVRYLTSGDHSAFGEIDGISHARREFSVDGLWYPFGAAYKAERPAEVKPETVPLSSVIDKVNSKYGEGLTEEDRVPTPYTIAEHSETIDKLNAGTLTVEEYKAAFARAIESREALAAEFQKMTKDAIMKTARLSVHYKNDTKDRIVKAAANETVEAFDIRESSTWVMGTDRFASLRNFVEGVTQADLDAYAAKRKAKIEEYVAGRQAMREGIDNPQTLEDFRNAIQVHKSDGKTFAEARMMLTPEQRATFDELTAEESRKTRNYRADQKAVVQVAAATTEGQIVQTKHTKTGEDLFVVKAAERVERDVYNQWNATAKKLGGWYSSFRGAGAVPGFQFKTMENAEAFLKYLGGDVSEAKAAVQERRDAFADDKSQSAVERLREMAERLDEKADEALGRDRKANTARRARFAAAAESAANGDKAMAATMRNIAQAIESGSAKFLDRVRQKTQIEMLNSLVSTAQWDYWRAKYPTYSEQERHKGEPAVPEVADYARFPQYTAFRSDLAKLGRQMLEIDGAKKIGQQLLSVADDVTDAYLEFAKANLHKVSTFKRGDGQMAAFSSRDAAEKAIARSGYKGKAIVLPFKRGQNIIVQSPSFAKENGIWEGDGDKLITLNAEVGSAIVAKGKELGRKLDVPSSFGYVAEKQARLKAMGIETPAEFRAMLREFIGMKQAPKAPDRVKELERAMAGKRNTDGLDFFPTPAGTVQAMLDAAEIEPGMRVLEPSAGMGHIADLIRDAGVEPDVVELSNERKDLLEAKGFTVVGRDFMEMNGREGFTFGDVFKAPDGKTGIMRGESGLGGSRVRLVDANGETLGHYDRDELTGIEQRKEGYDRILMNPPFGDRRDAQHVRHAFDLLAPRGRLVAIMGEGVFFGQDKKAQQFREWLESVGGTSEKLDEGTFLDPSLPVNTGVNARLVVIDKRSSDVAMFSRGRGNLRSRPRGEITHETQRLEKEINRDLSRQGKEAILATGFITRSAVPDNARRLVAAVEKLFGVRVEFVQVGDERANIFNGVFLGGNTLFVNVDSSSPVSTVIGHEFLHFLKESNPDLYAKAESVLLALANAKKFAAAATKHQPAMNAGEEVIADTFGDQFSNPEFWEEMANRVEPSLFMRIRAAFTRFMGKLLGEIKAMGTTHKTDALYSDLDAVRDAVLSATVGAAKGRKLATPSWSNLHARFMTAWHGSPHDHDGFDSSKIGTGEGAQAYGSGLYFSSVREIAEHYRNSLSDGIRGGLGLAGVMPSATDKRLSHGAWIAAKELSELLVSKSNVVQPFSKLDVVSKGRVLSVVNRLIQDFEVRNTVVGFIPIDVVNMLGGKQLSSDDLLHDPSVLINLLPVNANDLVPGSIDSVDVLTAAVALAAAKVHTGLVRFDVSPSDFLAASGAIRHGVSPDILSKIPHPNEFVKGRLYQVELAPAEDEYLDWDKPLSEQSEMVKAAVEGIYIGKESTYGGSYNAASWYDGMTGGEWYQARLAANIGDSADLSATRSGVGNKQKAASEYLRTLGIRGIKYLDGNSRPSIWKYDVDVFGSSGSLLKQHRVRTKAEADDIVADAEASGRAAKVKQIQQPDDQNHNYVIFDDADVKITAKESRRASNDLDFTQPRGSEPLRKTSFGYANDTHNLFHVSTFKGNDGDVSTFDVYDTNTGEQLGFVSLGLRDGQITTLVAIEAEQKNVGFGEQLLRSLVARNPDGIYIINMLPEAVPFWQKMGVSLDEHFEGVWEHGNGVLTEEAIQEARDGKRGLAAEDPGGRQKESRGNAESESGRQANNPVSSKGVADKTAPANAGVSVSAPSESVRRIQAVVERFKSQFKGTSALDIRVVSTTFDIPARFRPSPFAEGVFHDDAGLVYLVTMNLHNPRGELSENRAWQVLLHESVGHYGLSQMMGDKFASILKAVKQATLAGRKVSETQSNPLQPGDKDYTTWEAVKLRYPDATDAELAQEVLARMSETDPGSSVLGYAVAVVRQWVRDVARAMGIDLAVSTSELRDLVAKASGYMRRGDNLAEEHEPSGLVAASTGVAREGGKRGLESRAATVQPQGPIWSAPEMSRTDNIIYTMQDKNIDLKRVQQAIKSTAGEIRDDIDAYLQEELFHGRAAKITEEFLDKEVNPLISLMRASNVSMDELETFLWARHAKERNAQIAKINDEMPDGGSGLTNKQADDLMGGKDVTIGDKTIAGVKPARKKLLSDLAGRVDVITKGSRALLERYGLESAETLNAWDGAYQHYVPLHREDTDSHLAGMGTGQGYSVKGSSSKRATGSFRPVENILANLVLQRERIITRGEKNRVAQALHGLAKEMPNADLWEVDVKPTIRTTAMIGGREQVVDAVDPNFRNKPNVVFARFNGEDRFVVFNEHNERALRMAEALKNLDADDISHLLGEVSRWTRYFASINTQYNPIFGVTNLVRDVQTGLLNLKSTPLDGKQKEMAGNLVHALPAVFKALRADRKGQAATGTWAQLWEEFQEVGGQTGYRDMFRNSHERAEALQNALDPTWWQKTWWGKAATVGGIFAAPEQVFVEKVGKPFMELLSDYNTMMENGIRLSAYKLALDSGMTKERAASLAKNLTVNFNRKGQAGRQVGAMYAFFNASVQGTARMAETLNHGAKPGELFGKAGKQIIYGGLMLGALQAMLLLAAGFDDEEPPEFVRDRNIIIPTGNGKYISIPLPLGFHVLPAISRISIEFTAGGFKKPGEHLVHVMDVLLDSFNPIGNAGLSMQTVAPTVLDPIAALTENKDWSGRQIARQDFSKLNPTPGHTRAKDTASSLSRGLAYALNYLSGGGEYGIGIVSPTPDQIDYLLGQLTGGVGRELGKVLTTAEVLTTGEDLPPHKIPLVGRFYGDTTGQSSEASKFYGTLEKLSEHKGALDRMKDAHDVESYREYAKEHPEIRLYARAARVQREMASLRKLKRKMIERNADRAKVRQIEDRMRTLMTRFNQSVSEQKGDH